MDTRPLRVRGHRNIATRNATRRPTVGPQKTPRQHENSQLAGGFRSVWQVLGSNQRRLSRRFYSLILLSGAYAADLRLCHSEAGFGTAAVRYTSVGARFRGPRGPPTVGEPATDGH